MKKAIMIGAAVIVCAIYGAMNLDSIFAKEPKGELVNFRLGMNGMAYKSGYHYDAQYKNDELFVHMYYSSPQGLVEIKRAVNGEKTFMKNLDAVLKEQKVYKWNGFHKSAKHVLDGEGFGLYATYLNGKEPETIKASGSNSFPDGYWEVSKVIGKYFKDNVEKLPTVKNQYTYAEVKPEIMAALKYMAEQGIIKNTAGGEIFAFSARGNADLAMITIDVAMDPGHSFQLLTRNHKLLALKVVAADGKNIEPKCAVANSYGHKLAPTTVEAYEDMILRKEL